MRLILCLCLLAAVTGCDVADSTSEPLAPITLDLSGIVKTADGSVMPEASVRLEGERLSSSDEPALLQRAVVKDDGHFAFTATFPLLRVDDNGACIARVRTGEIQVVLVASGASGERARMTPACTEQPQTMTLVVP